MGNLAGMKADKSAWKELIAILDECIVKGEHAKATKERILELFDHCPVGAEMFVRGVGDLHIDSLVIPGIWTKITDWSKAYAKPANPNGIEFQIYKMETTSSRKQASAGELDGILEEHMQSESNKTSVRVLMSMRPVDKGALYKLLSALQASGGCSPKLAPALTAYLQKAPPSAVSTKVKGKVIEGKFPRVEDGEKPRGVVEKVKKGDTDKVPLSTLKRSSLIASTPDDVLDQAPEKLSSFESQYRRKGRKWAVHYVLKDAKEPMTLVELLAQARKISPEDLSALQTVKILEGFSEGNEVKHGWALRVGVSKGKATFSVHRLKGGA